MVVEDVYNPDSKIKIDPRVSGEKKGEDDPEYWDKKSKSARAKREYEEEERAARRAKELEENPPEPPFKIQGAVNLGTFDFQQQQEELKNTIQRIQDDAQSKINALEQANTHYRDEVQKIQIQMVENTLKAQIESMQRAIAEGVNRKEPDFNEQLTRIQALASTLGYAKKDELDGAPEIRLQILKMELEDKDRQRKFEWDKMMSEREWQIKLKSLENDVAKHNADIQAEKERRSMFVSPFESIGVAMARGLLDKEVTQSPPRKINTKKKTYPVEAAVGEAANLTCPDCEQEVVIGPTARSAICANCDARFSITRHEGVEIEEE